MDAQVNNKTATIRTHLKRFYLEDDEMPMIQYKVTC